MKGAASEIHSSISEKKSVKEYFADKIETTNPFYLTPVFTVIEDSNMKVGNQFFLMEKKKWAFSKGRIEYR